MTTQKEVKKEDEPWVKEALYFHLELQLVESSVEAFPQFHLLTALAIYDGRCFGPTGLNPLYTGLWIGKYIVSLYGIFNASQFCINNGPLSSDFSKMTRSHLKLLKLLLFVFVFALFSLQAFMLIIVLRGEPMQYGRMSSMLFWVGISFGIPIGFQVLVLVLGIGVKTTLKVIIKNPSILMVASFGHIYGPIHYDLNLSFPFCLKANCSWHKNRCLVSMVKSSEITTCKSLMIIWGILLFTLYCVFCFMMLYPLNGNGISEVILLSIELNAIQITVISTVLPAILFIVRLLLIYVFNKNVSHKVLYI